MKSFFPAISWAAAILLLTTMNAKALPQALNTLPGSDKLAHAAVFGLLTALILWGLKKQGKTGTGWLLAPVISSGYGLAIEILQLSFFPHRHFELFDIIANIIGSFGVWLVFLFIK